MSTSNKISKEQAILEAAMEEFGTLGVHGARMQAIANRAGVNKALLHYYFRSKEQLYMKVLSLILTPFQEQIQKGLASLSPGDFAGFVRILAQFVVDESLKTPYSRILLTELSCGGQSLSQMKELRTSANTGGLFADGINTFLEDCIEKKVIKPYHPMKIFMNVMGMCWNIFLGMPIANVVYEQTNTKKDEAFFKDYVELIVDMATSGLCTKQ